MTGPASAVSAAAPAGMIPVTITGTAPLAIAAIGIPGIVSAGSTLTGPAALISAQAVAGIAYEGEFIAGPAALAAASAVAGSVSVTASVSVPGQAARVSAAGQPGGSGTALSGPGANAAVSASGGIIASSAVLPGVPAALHAVAPAGVLATTAAITGSTPVIHVTSPFGGLSGNAVVSGLTACCGVLAIPAFISAGIHGAVALAAFHAVSGIVTFGSDTAGSCAGLMVFAPGGTVIGQGRILVVTETLETPAQLMTLVNTAPSMRLKT